MRTIVLDSNVLIAALRSKRGASNKLLSLVGTGVFTSVVSVPLIFEYEDVALRHLEHISCSADEVREIITFNLRDFRGIEPFGLQAQTPRRFLNEIHT